VACLRFMLRLLTVVLLALGIASAPLYAVAQAADGPAGMQADHGHMDKAGPISAARDHVSPDRAHTVDMGCCCCHRGCVMAVVPGFASLSTAAMPSVAVPIPRERGSVRLIPSGLERPPKLA